MCGIFGYIGKRNSSQICLNGLKSLEYRGYDSAGIAGIIQGKIYNCKEAGKVNELERNLTDNPLPLELAIAHTRWATHGEPSRTNAHPHCDEDESVALVHNGIIENHAQLRQMLEEKGITFKTDTDSEVIAHLISHNYEGDILKAFQKSLDMLEGFWGIALIHKDHPNQILAAARENPLAIGHHDHGSEAIISSDPNAFDHSDLDVLYLHNDEIAVITDSKVQVYNSSADPIEKMRHRLNLEANHRSKDGYEHYMLKEIFEQPITISGAYYNRLVEDFGTAIFDDLRVSTKDLQSVHRIIIVACGTSWHAATIAASLLEEKARIPTQAEIASEFRYKNPIVDEQTLVIAISQSGETLDTIAAVREVKTKGAKVIGVCNVPNSTLTREADSTLFLRAGPEISVCSTKAFTSQLTVLLLFTLLMGRLRHMNKEEGRQFIEKIKQLPIQVKSVLAAHKRIQEVAEKYSDFSSFFFLGRHYMFPTSLESALKLKEISYLNACGYPAGEMKHGPIALVCEELLTIGLCGNRATIEKTVSNLTEVRSRKGPVLIFAPESAKELESECEDIIYLPEVDDEFAPVVYSVATQLFAYYVAKKRGTDIDQPRNLAKSVTVE